MAKLAVFLTVCFTILFVTQISALLPIVSMEFVDEFRTDRPAIVRVSTIDMDLSSIISISTRAPTGVDEGKTYWDNNYIVSGSQNIVSDMNQDVLQENNFLVTGTSSVICIDEATRRPLVNLDYSSNTMTFIAVHPALHNHNFPTNKYGSFTFLCPMTIKTTQAFAPEYTRLHATQAGLDIEFTLAPPVAWSWRAPHITINSASYSANTGNLLGGKVKFQFSTDTAGIHGVEIRNGPQPIYYNRRNQEFTSYQCGDNVEAYIININGGLRLTQGASNSGLQIHVKDSAANGAPITCTVDVDGYMSSAFTERSQVVIEMDTVLVAQGIDFPVLDATFSVSDLAVDGRSVSLTMTASDLNFSASPLHTNSTIEIRFSGVDVNTHQQTNTEYRQDAVCSSLEGTFSQDGKSVFIKDVSQIRNAFSCTFNFAGTKIVRLDEFTPVPTIQVFVDGVSLYNRAVRSASFPLYLPFNIKIEMDQIQIYQDDSTIKHVVEFSLEDASYGVVPQKPILVLSYSLPATWPVSSYADVLSCEGTSPSSSAYTPLITTFDLERRTWTADLSTLINTDVYKINFRCTRSEAVVTKFDIVQNTANRLNVSFFDVVSGKGYIYSTTPIALQEQSPKTFLKRPTTPQIPTEFTQYFKFKGKFLFTDFATMSSVVDDLSTKALAVIKTGFDAYDAQTSPPTPVKLSPKPLNKATISLDLDIQSKDYSPSFAHIIHNLIYTIVGFQFQQPHVESLREYGPIMSETGHGQRTTPQIAFSQRFTSGSTYAEMQAFASNDASNFASEEIDYSFYKDAYSAFPEISFTFSKNGFDFASFSQDEIMNTISACGYYQVGYLPTKTADDYKFDYDSMAPSNTQNEVVTRFTCAYAEACISDADCSLDSQNYSSGYCSNGTCAVIKPTLKYPYVKYDTVEDFYVYDSYNSSIVTSLSAVIIAGIFALIM